MSNEADILTTMRTQLMSLDSISEEQLVYENEASDGSAVTELEIEESFTPFGEAPIGSGYDRLTGEVRYSVLVPRGDGASAGRKLATEIKQLFPAGGSIVGKITVTVDNSQVLSGRVRDETRFSIPVAMIIRVEALRAN